MKDLKSLSKRFSDEDLVRKVLLSVTDFWNSKVTTIYKAKDMSRLSVKQLIGSLMTDEILI